MFRRRLLLFAIIACGGAAPLFAQQPVTLQLPTFSYFTVSTSVLVPDGGSAYLGSVNRARSGSTYRGVPFASKTPFHSPLATNRGTSHTVAGSNMSVHATIIDHADLDQQVLAQAVAQRGILAANVAAEKPQPTATPIASITEIRQQQLAADDAKQQAARELFDKAVAYEEARQTGLAKIYFRMAAGRAVGDLKADALARLASLERSRGAKVVRD